MDIGVVRAVGNHRDIKIARAIDCKLKGNQNG